MNNEGLIYKAMCNVMTDISAIGKDRTNSTQGFKFRGIDDVYNELHDILCKHKIFTLPEVLEERTEERTTRNGGALIYRVLKMQYTFCAEDGSSVICKVTGEGMDSGDKAANKAMSIAHKYALFQTFLIPTEDEKDPDAQSHEVAPKKATPPKVDEPTIDAMREEMAKWVASKGLDGMEQFKFLTGGRWENPLDIKEDKNVKIAYKKYKEVA